ncbi:hypothetical protein LOCC1_G008206 [Lachnellula occidentalis]|uniref:PARP catalytic domain-containing protein n=1 Tax=Lachnellula occidentalis TaxID=215460 RepID=A0A8H8RFL9_9HELO|nr:hypothetical protein LOCC1_G008206 [Lachnellula occidentalis]
MPQEHRYSLPQTPDISTREQYDTMICDDEDGLYHPPWVDNPRGFINLRSKEAEDFNLLLDSFLPPAVIDWNCEEAGWTFKFEDLVLIVNSSAIDPVQVLATTLSMHRVYVDPLRRSLRRILEWPLDSRYDMIGFAMILLRLTEEVVMYTNDWKAKRKLQESVSSHEGKERGWNAKDIRDFNILLENSKGLDLKTVDESGDELLGSSIRKICDEIPEEFRILHVEPVFRKNIVALFRKRQKTMEEELSTLSHHQLRECVDAKVIKPGSYQDTRQDLVQELCKPKVSFHGTQRHLVSSIVRHGFIKPGGKAGDEVVDVRCGASFGVGIYSSPFSEFSLFYANMSEGAQQKTRVEDLPGLRLIVCAVLMGRAVRVTREETRRTTDIADQTAQSHVSPDGNEYVVFNASQIIPCYVIHLDLGAEEAKKALLQASNNPNTWKPPKTHARFETQQLFPGEFEALKQAKKAAASKWFPYGFGPAKGTSFVIEEIGEHSDDEEDYGEYQDQRQEVDCEIQDSHARTRDGESWFDEYQRSRTSYKGKKVAKDDESDEDDEGSAFGNLFE